MTENNTVIDKIGYSNLLYLAMINIVKEVLIKVSNEGLPSDHKFYISFFSTKDAVSKHQTMEKISSDEDREITIPSSLIEKYGEEITIVIEHQFKNLKVSKSGFDITLSFNNIEHDLYIPFIHVTRFLDSHVNFSLDFYLERNNKDANLTDQSSDSSKKSSKLQALKNDKESDFNSEALSKKQKEQRQNKTSKLVSFESYKEKLEKPNK